MKPHLICPRCRGPLVGRIENELRCVVDDLSFRRIDGIWRFLLPERRFHFARFLREYETVRRSEGRWRDDPAYFRALPFAARSEPGSADWRIRAATYRALIKQIVQPAESSRRPLYILDLGAGNCWLSHRLARRRHRLTAVDLQVNDWDGLGAHVYYPVSLTPIQAEFDRLPLQAAQFDLIVYNASLHYSEDTVTSLMEALRCLKPDGRIVITDTPLYRDPNSGRQMVQEREQVFQAQAGFRSNALVSENFLTYDRLDALSQALALHWTILRPNYGWRWRLRPLAARFRGAREPAAFALLVAART